ncbi:hypothetical protein Q4524_02350 [Alteromonas stellipolaris]|uniref:hypothetical protein n=1 Tax=Alteromonas stellipolaris TaxID=233316 RepID=UPI0026E1A7E5|nr:hypothetical protein [Alteromonas stellipolaris]MDO6537412.1 hypothetical protein [Alteromonas stellipolaris]
MSVELKKAIESITPDLLQGYLESQSWVKDGTISNKAIIWHRDNVDSYSQEVIQPTDSNIRSYEQRLIEAIKSVAEFESRTVLAVIDDMLNFSSDLIKVRVVHPDVEGGTIPLEDGVLLIEKSRDLMIASTLSTFKKQKVFNGSRSQNAQDFLSKLKLGQTEIGSFIVNLISPIEINTEIQKDSCETSLARSVTVNLARSLTAISEAMNNYANSKSVFDFEETVTKGVSANLCDALIGLSGRAKTRRFSIMIKAGGLEPGPIHYSDNYEFSSQSIPNLEAASEYLKGRYTVRNFEVCGFVSVLKHLPNEDNGQIIVKALVRGKIKSIAIQLSLDEYWQAFEAHKVGNEIACIGTLNVSPKSAQLLDPKGFDVIERKGGIFDDET